ncbi:MULTISPECIES: thiamine-phosphate kinase [Candidatus Ichthyocystis]|uniref:Thiamine-monophosphate kinase n=1 Tax=Candidatus Ichthyocystis hellenicum TaxID=1561003 RepID=A0A0S4M2C6_9BURK|nr:MULTISPECIES: thiamine-phosphate kinase [Ichthyocystis]CUT17913.1 putative thiamine-monophosphate kinase [Candidatus Ichthyocystis hellenicum]
MTTEEEIIDIFRGKFPLFNGIGDDSAVIPYQNNRHYITTQDSLVENIHFRTSYYAPIDLAHKAIAVNISDISAMGGSPLYLWNSISFPKHRISYMNEWSREFCEFCLRENISIMGGDITESPNDIYISITLIGVIDEKYIKRMAGAQCGDLILLCGNPGHAHIGLLSYENGISDSSLGIYREALKNPKIRTDEGKWIAQQKSVHSMTDTSDGILVNLRRMLKKSQKSACIEQSWFQPPLSFIEACKMVECNPETTQLIGGEDYSLMFCTENRAVEEICTEFKKRFGYTLKIIGIIAEENNHDITIKNHGVEQQISSPEFNHFMATR